MRKLLALLLLTAPPAAFAGQLFNINDVMFTQIKTGNALLPDPSEITLISAVTGGFQGTSLTTFGSSDPYNAWVAFAGGEIDLSFSFRAVPSSPMVPTPTITLGTVY